MTTLPLVLLFALTAMAGDRPKISVLIVDGINNHDWRSATQSVRKFLLATNRFTVDVSTSPTGSAPQSAWDQWRPSFAKYQAVIVNFNGGHKPNGIRWPKPIEESFEKYVLGGGGVVFLHAANNGFLECYAKKSE